MARHARRLMASLCLDGCGCVVQIQGTIEATMAEAKVGGCRCCSVSLSLLAQLGSVCLAD